MNETTTTAAPFRVEISPDGMEALLFVEVRGRDRRLQVRDVVRALREDYELVSVDDEKVTEAIAVAALAEEGEALPGICVARGMEAVEGEDGSLVWLGEFFESRAIVLPDGSVDHYHHTRSSVYEGQPLVELRPPTEGTPGRDVRGKPRPAVAGRPVTLVLDAGVAEDPDHPEIIVATRGGQVEFDHDHLGVSELLRVQEVDYSVGSIDFDGSVEVQGNVGAQFEVRGGASVKILGSVDNAEIESDRQVEILGPVLGRGEARISSGADMLLASAREAEIHCGGKLVVQGELVWCEGEVFEDLCVERGRIVGGEWKVGGKIIAAEVGSRKEVTTRIRLGESEDRARALRQLYRVRRKALEELQSFARHHAANLQRSDGGPHAPAEREQLLKRQAALRAVARRARRREMVARKRLQRRRRASQLLVTGTLHPGVEVHFVDHDLVHRITEALSGPVRVGLDSEGHEVEVVRL